MSRFYLLRFGLELKVRTLNNFTYYIKVLKPTHLPAARLAIGEKHQLRRCNARRILLCGELFDKQSTPYRKGVSSECIGNDVRSP